MKKYPVASSTNPDADMPDHVSISLTGKDRANVKSAQDYLRQNDHVETISIKHGGRWGMAECSLSVTEMHLVVTPYDVWGRFIDERSGDTFEFEIDPVDYELKAKRQLESSGLGL